MLSGFELCPRWVPLFFSRQFFGRALLSERQEPQADHPLSGEVVD